MADRRATAWLYIQRAVREGMSANETLRQLREVGLSYRRTDFLADYRRAAQIPVKADRLKYVPKKYRPGDALYIEQPGFMAREYRYTVKLTVRNTVTGEVRDIYNRMASDTELSIARMIEIAQEVSKGSLEESNVIIERALPVMAERRAAEPWMA